MEVIGTMTAWDTTPRSAFVGGSAILSSVLLENPKPHEYQYVPMVRVGQHEFAVAGVHPQPGEVVVLDVGTLAEDPDDPQGWVVFDVRSVQRLAGEDAVKGYQWYLLACGEGILRNAAKAARRQQTDATT